MYWQQQHFSIDTVDTNTQSKIAFFSQYDQYIYKGFDLAIWVKVCMYIVLQLFLITSSKIHQKEIETFTHHFGVIHIQEKLMIKNLSY
mmetsp:Transcript_51157/g.76657  ORF Transcript_51157/g.76657 Transcript_51157/m.76657 type:complete len:88 (-) Transcript_51157:12-275(-)